MHISVLKKMFFCFLIIPNTYALKIDRVILATDNNPEYIQFWPIAAQAWQDIVGVRPTLALIGGNDVQVDETYGDVIRFEPIPGIPTSFYAQCVRLLLPALFPEEGCIVADIDLIPLQKRFFIEKVEKIPDDHFVVYRDKAYWFYKSRIYMNYNAAKGSTFRDIFKVTYQCDIPTVIQKWHKLGIGWSTDERMLYKYLKKWKIKNKHRVTKLGYTKGPNRIDRRHWSYKLKKLLKQKYVEMNCPKPYAEHKKKIDPVFQLALLAAKLNDKKNN